MSWRVAAGALTTGMFFLGVTGAQVAPTALDSKDPLQEVIVTATRTPQSAADALEPVIVIDRGALENSLAMDLGDVLRFNAGLDIGRNGGPGQPLSLFIRGANSDQSIVMIDGVRINPGTIGGAPLQNVAPELFERVEIIEGPRSAIYGTDAIGGVVNLITRTGGFSSAEALLDYGRYASREAAIDGAYVDGDTRLQAAFTDQQSSGFPSIVGDALNSGYQNLSGTAAASTKVGGADLGAFYWLATGTTRYANGNYNDDFSAFSSFTPLSEHFSNSVLAAHLADDVLESWHVRLLASRAIDDLRQRQVDAYNLLPVGDFDFTSRDTIDLQNDVKISSGAVNQDFTFGTMLIDEHTHSLSFGTGYTVDTHTQTYYVQDQVEAGGNRLLLSGGYYHHPAFGNHETWNAEYGYSIGANTVLIASAGTAFRAPSATDRFGYAGNPNLLPESSRDFELGAKFRVDDSQQLSLSIFQDVINDLIVFVPDPTNIVYFGENQNVDRARIRGVEASWQLRTDSWSARAQLSWQNPEDLSDDTELLRRTKHSFGLSASRRIAQVELGSDLLVAGSRQDLSPFSEPVTDGGYFLAAFYGRWSITDAWSVTARLDNAFDRRYELANGYNTAGRAASIAVRYSFRPR